MPKMTQGQPTIFNKAVEVAKPNIYSATTATEVEEPLSEIPQTENPTTENATATGSTIMNGGIVQQDYIPTVTPAVTPPTTFQKYKKYIVGGIVLVVLLVGGYFGYKYFFKKPKA